MIRLLVVVVALASAGRAQEVRTSTPAAGGHETMEDKARTVKGGASKGVKACHADIERWCKAVKPGEGRLGTCLKANSKKLSKSCRRWASHGGPAAMEEALTRDIDGAPPPAAATPVPETKAPAPSN